MTLRPALGKRGTPSNEHGEELAKNRRTGTQRLKY